MKSILMVTALAIASLSIASAGTKSYEIVLKTPSQAGQTELSAGHYLVKVNGAFADFVNVDNNHHIMVPVKVEAVNSKFDNTAVDTTTENGVSQIQSIELQDTNSKLEF
jgi:hypothetical protein